MEERFDDDLRQDPDFLSRERYTLQDLDRILAFLRSDIGCPWDRVQTAQSLQKHLLEEAYEAYDAIEQQDETLLREELGDVLLQIVFQAGLAESFSLSDVVTSVSRKMISRHSHIFGRDSAASSADVDLIWEENKRKEKQHNQHSESLRDVARALPALSRAEKLQKRAAKAGFDWPDIEGPRQKITEEASEAEDARQALLDLKDAQAGMEAIRAGEAELEMEVGDLLFAVVNWARHAGVDPEIALDRANRKFLDRFARTEKRIQDDRLRMEDMSLEELDHYWDLVKDDLRADSRAPEA